MSDKATMYDGLEGNVNGPGVTNSTPKPFLCWSCVSFVIQLLHNPAKIFKIFLDGKMVDML